MKQIKALACSNSQEILGRVTLNGKNIFNRSAYILVTNAKDTPKGIKQSFPHMTHQTSHQHNIFKLMIFPTLMKVM